MSLFKTREWWSTVVGEDEEFDTGCLCTGNIDNSNSGYDKIIIGSYHGILRIYNPHPAKGEDGSTACKPEDVVCETDLYQPIIQVESGRFLSGADSIHLAVLHPRKISVYSLAASTGTVEHGTQYKLQLGYEHKLQRTAYNFCIGPFGGVKGRDFICVQSMDGTLSVYEQESFAFSRFLPGALLPGPLRYVPKTDSFITVSSNRSVESYKYQVLAVATDAKTKEESQNIKSGKKVAFDWSFNLGEQAIDLLPVSFLNAPPSIYVLGERSLFTLTEGGKLRTMKKLDFNPSCFVPYTSVSEGTINCMVAGYTNTLMIYQDITLRWAAQLTHVPLQIRVANLLELKGAIVTLDEEGHVQCSYLGTDPSMFTTPTVEVRDIDYAQCDREMAQLQRSIKEQQGKAMVLPSVKTDDEIQIQIEVPYNLDELSQANDAEFTDDEPIPSITVKVMVKAKAHVNNVRLTIHTPSPLASNESLVSFSSIEPTHPTETQVVFYVKDRILPSNLKVDFTVNYQSTGGAPRVVSSSARLPMKVAMLPALPVKVATCKVTVETNKPPVNLNDLFPDMLGESAGGPGNALGFRHLGTQVVVTMLASKTSQRYRLQCDQFEAMWLPLSELVGRLASHFRGYNQKDFRMSYEGGLPLQEYFEVLDKHFERRQEVERLKKMLEERAAQFRAVQRRLLTRFKDKTPSPLANLDTLLDGTYRQMLAIGDAAEQQQQITQSAAADLSCATRILNLLLKLWQDMTDDEYIVLEGALTPDVSDNGQQGWEEMVDAAITHLLRTCLAKSAKDQTVNPSPLGMLKDTTKLKKHIALMCDRVGKGARLAVEGMAKTASSTPSSRPVSNSRKQEPPPRKNTKNLPTTLDPPLTPLPTPGPLGQAEVPLGSRFGEKKDTKRSTKGPAYNDISDLNGLSDLSLGGPAEDKTSPRGLAPLTGKLPSMDSDLPALHGELPPLSGGNKYMKRSSSRPSDDVPDLDDMETPGSDDDERLVNGSGELVYGL